MPLETSLVVLEILENLQAIAAGLVIVGQHFGEDVSGEGSEVAGQRNSTFADHLKIRLHLEPLVAGLPHEHLVKNDSECPHIALLGIDIVDVSFGSHVLGRSDVIEHLRLIGHLRHLAVAKIYERHSLAHLRPCLEEHVVGLEVAVHDALAADLPVSFQNLAENEHCLFFGQAVGGALEVFCESATLKELSDQIDIVFLNDHVQKTHHVLVGRVLYLAQIAQSRYLAAQQVPCDLVVDFPQIYGLDRHLHLRGEQQEAEIDVSSRAFAQKLRLNYGVFVVDRSGLLQLHA